MIEIRRLGADDLIQLDKIQTIAWNERKDYSQWNEEEDPPEYPAEWSWGAFEGGKLLSGMHEIEFLMRFDGKNAKMSGIGGVATRPEARRSGLVRGLFEKFLPDAYEKGVIFSTLTPFSHDFYRFLGYEVACDRNEITIVTKDFLGLPQKGEFIPIFPGDDPADLQKVHSAYISDINHGICRDYWPENRAWKRFTEDDPYSTGTFLYLWKDENGVPRSYIKYKDKDGGAEGRIMSVVELAFIDKEGLYGALGLVGGLSSQYKQFRWLMPTFIDACDFIGNTWEIDQRLIPRDMTRVVNVKAALEMMRLPQGEAPHGEGEYVVEVKDAGIPANNGKYLVEFGQKSGSRVSLTQKEADLQCDVGTLSQLITGYRTLGNSLLSRRFGLAVNGNLETLNRVFTLRPQHVTEYF